MLSETLSDSLPRLNIPLQKMRLNLEGKILKVYDSLRKKYVVMTPEEFVRQQFTSWLIDALHFPPSLMANEVGIKLNDTLRRCDTVVFNSDGSYLMIIEYKAPYINITQEIFNQIVRYNIVLKASYLTVTNGMEVYCCRIDYPRNAYDFLQQMPDYSVIKLK